MSQRVSKRETGCSCCVNDPEEFMKGVISGWIGLQNIAEWRFGKKYTKGCQKSCPVPGDPHEFLDWLINMFKDENDTETDFIEKRDNVMNLYPNGISRDDFINNLSSENSFYQPLIEQYNYLVELLPIKEALVDIKNTNANPASAQRCHLIASKLVPEECVLIWNTGSILLNNVDKQEYQMIEKVRCPINCGDNTYIYGKLGAECPTYYVIFSFGNVLVPTDLYKTYANLNAMIFVLKYLNQYIASEVPNHLILAGHSIGFINALLIAQVLAYNETDFAKLIKQLRKNEQFLCISPIEDDDLYNDLYFESNFDLCNYNSIDANSKPLDEAINIVTEFQQFRDDYLERIKNNIFFVGSGGAPLMTPSIPPSDFASINAFFNHNIIHFGIAAEGVIDPYLTDSDFRKMERRDTYILKKLTNTGVWIIDAEGIGQFDNKGRRKNVTKPYEILAVDYIPQDKFKLQNSPDFPREIHDFRNYRNVLKLLVNDLRFSKVVNYWLQK